MKKILIIAFLFIGLKGVGQIKLPAPVVRNSPTDSTYGTHYDSLSYKGFRISSSITNRNAIPMALRGLGMVVNVVGDSSYTLKTGLTNSDWVTYKPGGGSGNSKSIFTGGDFDINTVVKLRNKKLTIIDTFSNVVSQQQYNYDANTPFRFYMYNKNTPTTNYEEGHELSNRYMLMNFGSDGYYKGVAPIQEYTQFYNSANGDATEIISGPYFHKLSMEKGASTAYYLFDTANFNIKNGITPLFNVNAKNGKITTVYKNNAGLDSVLSTDANGNLRNVSKGSGNLQQVTDLGNETTNTIVIGNSFNDFSAISQYQIYFGSNASPNGSTLSKSDDFSNLKFPNSGSIEKYIPVSVNGVFSDAAGNITVSGGGGGTVDTQYLRRDINLKFDSLRNNNGVLEGGRKGVFTPQLIIPTSISIYTTNGTLTSPRRVNGNGYLLKFDSTKVSFSDTSNIAGHLYDFNNGVSFVDYNSTNTSSLIQTEISGVKFSTNDRNNLDTSNNVWVKNDKVELNSTNRIDINSRTFYPATYTTAGTTGNQTINKNSGSVNIAPAITTITVTNNLVTANTIVTARVSSNDATAEILNVVSVTNGFIITMSTPATNEAQIKFWITN